MSDQSAVMALKNAWNGVVAASERMRELGPSVQSLPDGTAVKDLDLETYHTVAMAQANAAMALRGLVEQLQQKAQTA
jgi:hypothetical protein